MKLSRWVGGILIFAAFVIAGKVNAKDSPEHNLSQPLEITYAVTITTLNN